VPGIFFTTPLVKTASNGSSWTHVDAYFNETQVFANVLLSAYSYQLPERFMSFQPSWAEAYIVTPETPMSGGLFPFPTRRDNTVFLTTDRLTFWLQVNNGGSNNSPTSASAVGVIYDYAPAATFDFTKAVKEAAKLWAQNSDNRRTGAHWAAATLLAKPGVPPHISQRYAEEVFWIAIDPATYRSLTLGRGLSPSGFETWIKNFYCKMLLH
jgi:hypothetical protein